jgi:hypothetical protein
LGPNQRAGPGAATGGKIANFRMQAAREIYAEERARRAAAEGGGEHVGIA